MTTVQKLKLRKTVAVKLKMQPDEGWVLSNNAGIPCWYSGGDMKSIPAYESDISAAWEVVEKMHQLKGGAPWLDIDLAELLAMPADEAALAICKAAVAA